MNKVKCQSCNMQCDKKKIFEDKKELCELFCKFFIEKVQKLAKGIKKNPNIDPLEKLRNKMKAFNIRFGLKIVSESEVMTILSFKRKEE